MRGVHIASSSSSALPCADGFNQVSLMINGGYMASYIQRTGVSMVHGSRHQMGVLIVSSRKGVVLGGTGTSTPSVVGRPCSMQ
jgi:hypothetical protein